MKKYIKPLYEMERVETEDIMLISLQVSDQEVTVGNIMGKKVSFDVSFDDLWEKMISQ